MLRRRAIQSMAAEGGRMTLYRRNYTPAPLAVNINSPIPANAPKRTNKQTNTHCYTQPRHTDASLAEVLATMRPGEILTTRDIADRSGRQVHGLGLLMARLVKEGKVKCVRKRHSKAGQPATWIRMK